MSRRSINYTDEELWNLLFGEMEAERKRTGRTPTQESIVKRWALACNNVPASNRPAQETRKHVGAHAMLDRVMEEGTSNDRIGITANLHWAVASIESRKAANILGDKAGLFAEFQEAFSDLSRQEAQEVLLAAVAEAGKKGRKKR